MSLGTLQGQARTSCERCHRRKKKCDRTLPQCNSCQSAQIACSFLDDANREVGTFPIAFVRGLENRIQELETKLATLEASYNPDHIYPTFDMNDVQFMEAGNIRGNSNGSESAVGAGNTAGVQGDGADAMTISGFPNNQMTEAWAYTEPSLSVSFVDELKLLSLEATAERHLGSSSGLSFAKLTQSVLRRLSPDKADFVFNLDLESGGQLQNALEPTSLTDFGRLESSISCFPTLFGSFPMSHTSEPDDVLSSLDFPNEQDLKRLVDFYFAHSHTLYPFIHRSEFISVINRICVDRQDPVGTSPLWLFRIWMVLAIGSTAYSSVMLHEESESMLYYNKAMFYFEAALEYGNMAALEAILLQVSYSFFNQLGPNTWILVGLAARMATGIGLHTPSSYENVPVDVVERRKRVFFCIYMMDRVVSMALGRPFALHDDDIDILPFEEANDEFLEAVGILSPSPNPLERSQMAIPLHILALRRLASKIVKKVYSDIKTAPRSLQERVEIVQSLHKELIDWRRNMPFPLQEVHPRVPHFSSTWYDFNYQTHLAMLYRPSPLLPTPDQQRVKILAMAAAMSIREAVNMHRQQRFAYNWLNLLALYTSTLSLIYAVTAQPDNLIDVLKETKAIDDLELAMVLFDTLGVKFPAAKKIRLMVEEIVKRYKGLCSPE